MAAIKPVSRSNHAGRFWRSYSDMFFAAADTVAPLVATELPRACLCLPLAFLRDGGRLTPVAVQGLDRDENLCVTPDGKWRFPYIPACYRGHPFSLRVAPEDRHVLCVDMDSGLVSDSEGKPFFDEDGETAESIAAVLRFLRTVAADRARTGPLCEQLESAGLLAPWPVSYRQDDQERRIEGLLSCDEAALRDCDGDTLQALQASGALKLAYCQLLSRPHADTLVRLKQAKAQAFDPARDDIEDLLGGGDEVLEFNF